MPLISVIVPVYNAEKFLHYCIDSILNQIFNDFELILVDDGSTDNSGKICDEYAGKDARAKVIHKQNGGVSSARNAGIEAAKGEYICFVDSDDYLEKDYLFSLYNGYDDCVDLVLCGYNSINKDKVCNTVVFSNNDEDVLSRNDVMPLFQKVMISAPWCKLFKRKIVTENNVIFPADMSLGEDMIFNFTYLDYVKKFKVINKPLYNYRNDNEISLLRKYRKEIFDEEKLLNERWYEIIKKWQLDDKSIAIYNAHVFWSYDVVMNNTFSPFNKEPFFKKLKYNRGILKSKEFKSAYSNFLGKVGLVQRVSYKIHSYLFIYLYGKIRGKR